MNRRDFLRGTAGLPVALAALAAFSIPILPENNWLYVVATGEKGAFFKGWVNGLRREDGSLDYNVGFQPVTCAMGEQAFDWI